MRAQAATDHLLRKKDSQSRTVSNSIASQAKHYGVESVVVAILLATYERSVVGRARSYLISNIHDKPAAATLLGASNVCTIIVRKLAYYLHLTLFACQRRKQRR